MELFNRLVVGRKSNGRDFLELLGRGGDGKHNDFFAQTWLDVDAFIFHPIIFSHHADAYRTDNLRHV